MISRVLRLNYPRRLSPLYYARKTPLAARGFNVPDFQTGIVTIVGSARVRTVKSDREENARGAEAEDPLLICIVNSDEGGVAGWGGGGGGRKGLKNRVAAAVSCEKRREKKKCTGFYRARQARGKSEIERRGQGGGAEERSTERERQ